MRKTRAILFLLFIFPLFVSAQTLDDKLKEIDDYAVKVLDTWKGPGMAIAIVKDDNTVFAKGYGVRELGKPDKVDENTIFEIASNSKAFTTAALAILVDEKKLNWDDKVHKYLPDFQMYDPWVTSELTIRDLVSHRVGLATFSGDMLWFNTTYNMDELLRRARYLKPTSSFRTRYGYQNLMFAAAGRIIEKVSGKSWNDFVKERLMDPIGMTRSKTKREELTDNVARAHNASGGTLRVLPLNDGAAYQAGFGAVGVNASVADLSRWIRLQLGRGTFEGKKIFSTQQSWNMWQPNIMIPIGEQSSKNNPTRHFNSYGMGWFIYDYHGRKILNHSGGLDGMLSYTVLIPEENAGFVVLTNNEGPGFAIMMNKILDVMVGAPKRDFIAVALARDVGNKKAEADEIAKIDASRLPNTKPSLPLVAYAGTFTSDMYGDVTVAEENGKLVMRMVPTPSYVADLEHWHLDTWQIRWRPSVGYNFPRGFVTFMIDKNGKSDQIKIDQPNNDLWFYELDLKRTK
ncbi:MAG: serine hydrolase [Pyrinomonadaceae bacterium]